MDIVLYITYPNVYLKIVLFCFRPHRDISKYPFINIPSVVHNLARLRTGVMPLYETTMALLTNACVSFGLNELIN